MRTIEPWIEVAAGLVFRERRLLITRRRAGDHLGGFWEFPGGKKRADETFEECLARELMEELGIEVRVGRLFEEMEHEYPDRRVRLRFYLCRWLRHEPRALGCEAVRWVDVGELEGHEFPAADARLVDRLRRAGTGWQDGPAGNGVDEGG
jgi:8-oxo-dGTP diphosphatase